MRFQIFEMITRAEPAVQPAMALYIALVAAASVAAAVVLLAKGVLA